MKKGNRWGSLLRYLRRVRDSNPRYPKGVYRISSPARSITLPTLLFLFADAKLITFPDTTKGFMGNLRKLFKSEFLQAVSQLFRLTFTDTQLNLAGVVVSL